MKIKHSPCMLIVLFASLTASVSMAADLATIVDRTSHRASSHDRTGGNDDNLMSFEPGRSAVLLDTDGPGQITHMWFTVSPFEGHATMLRDLVIRIYWEHSKTPSVEVPLGDFFGLGHGKIYPVQSLPINVGADPRALNCYWPMPFYKHARIELFNKGRRSIRRIYYNLDYELGPIPADQGLFHAEFRRVRNLLPQPLENNTSGKDNYVILDARGQGQYMGCFLFVDSAPGGWWGEGDEMIFLDGESKPSINGTGTEDYFCEAWGFDRVTGFPYYGLPLKNKLHDGWTQTACYRFHVPDPIRFKKSIRVTIEHTWTKNVANDYSSVAYWYQREPCAARPPLPEGDDYQPRNHAVIKNKTTEPTSLRWSASKAEPGLLASDVSARAITCEYGLSKFGGYLKVDSPNKEIPIVVPVPTPGVYRVQTRLVGLGESAPVRIRLQNGSSQTIDRVDPKGTVISLGTAKVGQEGKLVLVVRSAAPFAVDYVAVEPVK